MCTESRRMTAARVAFFGLACTLLWAYWEASTISVPVPGTPVRHSYVDMHVHTNESDGDRSAEEQLLFAAEKKVPHVWITDHDMIRNISRTRALQDVAHRYRITLGFGACTLVLVFVKRAAPFSDA